MTFFKDKRDVNIHATPIDVRADIGIQAIETLGVHLSESVTIEMFEGGQLVGRRQSESPPAIADREAASRPATIRTIYRFGDWARPEDVITLCRTYLDELAAMVVAGRKRGFLT
jgi:hypothetical protein